MASRAFVAILIALASLSVHATTYTLEPDYTQGVFSWNHLGYSRPFAHIAQGRGTLEFDSMDPTKSSISVSIALSGVNTGVPALDDHLRSDDFFNVAKFPVATFRSTQVQKGAAANQLKIIGNLSLHGVTKQITLDATLLKIGSNPRTSVQTVGFDATTTLLRSDFGLGLFVPQVADKIEIRLTCQAAEAKGYADFLKKQAAEEAASKK